MYDNSAEVTRWFNNGGDIQRLNYDLNANSVVVDLGGFRGEFADKLFKKYGCNVLVFEPIQAYYQNCVKTNIGNPKVKIYELGVSGYTKGVVKISIEGDASSIFKADETQNTVDIHLVPVSTLFSDTNIKKIDLLKINVEGAEFDIIEALIKDGNITKITDIQVQFHTFVPNAEERREELRKQLAKTHHLTFDYPFVWENWSINT